MPPPKKKQKLTKEEIASKKSDAAKARLQKIKNDPVLLAQHKEKERLKYLKKKEKGQRKCIKDMTARDQRKARKNWKKYSSDYRQKKKVQQPGDNNISQKTPPSSDAEMTIENEPPTPLNENIVNENLQKVRQTEARKRSNRQRKVRNALLKKQFTKIAELKTKLNTQQKKYYRLKQKLKKVKKALTPKSKIMSMAEDPNQRREVVKKALFGEVLRTQISENYSKATTTKEKSNYKKLLSGPTSEKYKIWRLDNKFISQKKLKREQRIDIEDKRKASKKKIVTIIEKFYEDDSVSRAAAGKKECVTRNKIKKQKRYLLDSLKNIHKKFLKTNSVTIGYSLFCKLRPFWVVPPKLTDRDTCACIVHENIDLKLSSLKTAKILGLGNHQSALQALCCDRYSEKCLFKQCAVCCSKTLPYEEFDNSENITMAEWKHEKEIYKDPKTKKERIVSKYKKKSIEVKPRDLILQLETDLEKFLKHEGNIVHQYQTVKFLKQSLTDKDAVIHMDFSENYATKCNQEIQSYHFGGSRTQISLHTVVVYTKDSTTAHCTISANLAHNVAAIWAHLQPVLQSLPSSIENLHFLSDGPVTQYRNKTMFFILACKLQDCYPHKSFTWNYHEAGHGKGAPDGIGATCKRTADKIIAQKSDITNFNEFSNTLRENCPGIKISVIEDKDIETFTSLVKMHEKDQQSFKGTLNVHQVTGGVHSPNKLILKSLSCFCNLHCDHYKLGSLEYKMKPDRLKVSDVYTDSEDDTTELIQNTKNVEAVLQAGPSQNCKDKSKITYGSGDYVLVKLMVKSKEYRYAAICSSYDDDEGELMVTFLKIHNDEENLFKIDDNDVADVPYEDIIKKLPIPNLIVKGDRVYYKFTNKIDVFEK